MYSVYSKYSGDPKMASSVPKLLLASSQGSQMILLEENPIPFHSLLSKLPSPMMLLEVKFLLAV